jgi:hypothetical protein
MQSQLIDLEVELPLLVHCSFLAAHFYLNRENLKCPIDLKTNEYCSIICADKLDKAFHLKHQASLKNYW